MNILHSWWCFCVSAVGLTGEQKPHGGRSHSRPEMFLSLVERFLITAIIKLPSYCHFFVRRKNECDHSYTQDLTILVAWYSLPLFFKCRSLITLPSGTGAETWEYCVAACCWHFNRLYIAAACTKHHPLVHCSCLSVPDMHMPPQTPTRTHAHAQCGCIPRPGSFSLCEGKSFYEELNWLTSSFWNKKRQWKYLMAVPIDYCVLRLL